MGTSKGMKILFDLNRMLLRRFLQWNLRYSVVIGVGCLVVFGISYGRFVFQKMVLGQEFYKSWMMFFTSLIFLNFVILDYRYRNHFSISFFKINRFPYSPFQMFFLFFKISFVDFRILLYFNGIVPLIIVIKLLGFSDLLVIIFTLAVILCLIFFEIVFAAIFFFREQLSVTTNAKISAFLSLSWFPIMWLNAQYYSLHIPVVNLPIMFLLAAKENNVFLSFAYLGLLLLLCFLAFYSGYVVSKKYI
ncbi:MAG: hypothetical protein JXA06_00715 [Bacteroidetes bacterium]|nr:hypothetical protein [Bacteroidota bacterium]